MTHQRKKAGSWGLLAVIAAGAAVLFGVIFFISWVTVMGGFERLERKFVQRNIARSQEVIADRINNLIVKISDWSSWDDTYAFIEDKNEAYIKSNLVDNALEVLKIDMILFFDLRGEPAFVLSKGAGAQATHLIPEGLKEQLVPGSPLLTHPDEKSFVRGIAMTPEGPLMIVSKPVLRSDMKGPVRGTMIFATYLNAEELKLLGGIIHVGIEAQRMDAPALPPDFAAARKAFSQGAETFVQVRDAQTIAGFSLLKDIDGKEALILKGEMPREITQFGRRTLDYLGFALMIAALVSGVVIYVPLVLLRRKSEIVNDQRKLLSEMTGQVPGVVYQFYSRPNGERGFYYISERAESIFGLSPALEGALDRFVALIEPGYRESFLRSNDQAVREASEWKYEGILRKPSGEKIWFSGHSIPSMRGEEIVFNGILEDITERKNTEKEMNLLKKQMEFILGATRTGLDIIDSDFNMVYIDPEWAKSYGRYENKKCYDYFMGKNEVCPSCGIVKALETKKTVVTEEVLAREGNRNVQVTTIPFQDENGAWLVAEVNADITLRKQAEELVRKNAEMVQLLLNSTAEAIYGLDMKGSCTLVNAACLKVLGYERQEELLGKNMHEMIHSKYADGTPYDVKVCPIFRAFQAGQGSHVESEVLWRKDGTCFPAEYWSYPIFQEGKIVGSVVTFLDISERRRAEEAQEEARRFLSAAINSIPDIFYVFDIEGKFVLWNRSLEKMSGYPGEEISRMRVMDFFDGGGREHMAEAIKEILKNGTNTAEEAFLTKDGRKIPMFFSASAAKDASGGTIICGTGKDISLRKRLEEEGRKNFQELEVFYKASMGREGRIIELKEEVERLRKELGK